MAPLVLQREAHFAQMYDIKMVMLQDLSIVEVVNSV